MFLLKNSLKYQKKSNFIRIGATSCKNESVSKAVANIKEKPAQRRKCEGTWGKRACLGIFVVKV